MAEPDHPHTQPVASPFQGASGTCDAYDVVPGLVEPDGTPRGRFAVRLHRAVAP